MAEKFLPGTGRGTTRGVVEGALLPRGASRITPSTVFDGPPPRAGEES